MTTQRMVGPSSLDLGRWGVLRVADTEHVEIASDGGKRAVEVPPSLLSDGGALVGWLYDELGLVILGTSVGVVLVEVDLSLDEARDLVTLERDPLPDLRFLSFREAGAAHVIAHWECGLLCLDDRGAVMWKTDHEDASSRVVSVRGGVIWLQTQWPSEIAGRRRGYRLQDGALVDGF